MSIFGWAVRYYRAAHPKRWLAVIQGFASTGDELAERVTCSAEEVHALGAMGPEDSNLRRVGHVLFADYSSSDALVYVARYRSRRVGSCHIVRHARMTGGYEAVADQGVCHVLRVAGRCYAKLGHVPRLTRCELFREVAADPSIFEEALDIIRRVRQGYGARESNDLTARVAREHDRSMVEVALPYLFADPLIRVVFFVR